MRSSRMRLWWVALCAWLLLLMGALPGAAQGGATPVQIGQNVTGTLSAEAGAGQFVLTASGGETALIQVLALPPGFAPRFRVLNPQGVEIVSVSNPDGKSTITGSATFNDAGTYTIVVEAENGGTGQYVLSLQPGAPLAEPVTLTLGQPVSGLVGSQSPVQRYHFNSASLGAVALTVQSTTPGAGALVTLYDESAGKTIASSDAGVIGVSYQLPAAERLYRVEVRAGAPGDTAFTICLGNCGGSLSAGNGAAAANGVLPTDLPPQVVATAPPAGCAATSSAGGPVNLRSGPGTGYAVLASLPLGQTAPVTGVWTGGSWYVVNVNGFSLWVSGAVVNLSGDCSALPAVAAPANAPLAPTKPPTQPPPSQPIETPETETGDGSSDNNSGALPNLTIINAQISNPGDGTLNVNITVVNAGDAPVDMPYAVETCIDNDNCHEIPGFAAGLQPGETMSFTDGLPFTPNGANHTMTVTVDSRREVTESNESDNDVFSSFNL